MKNRVLLGMSGGVDSSVAAILLKKQGYEVIGATMKLLNDEIEGTCCGLSSICDAKRVCDILDIPHYTLNFVDEFKENVIDNFIECYKNAMTPNPCIECNRFLKFKYFYKKALELDCEYIATGHYAKTEFSNEYNAYVIKKSKSIKKDQSYVLYNIPKEIISKVLFPLGDFETKDEIRKIAEDYKLNVAKKPDSQEICFIPDDDYGKFLIENLKEKPKIGNIVNSKKEILGKHRGLIYYTIGQRKGLQISSQTPLYVIELNKDKNELVVGTENEIFSNELYANDLNFTVNNIENEMKIKAKIRYNAKEEEATLYQISDDLVKVVFNKPQRAITYGQSVVFYHKDIIIGGGKIIRKRS